MIIPLRLDPEVPEEAEVINAYKSRPPRRRQEFMRRLIIQALRANDSTQSIQTAREPIFSSEVSPSHSSLNDTVEATSASHSSSNLKGIF